MIEKNITQTAQGVDIRFVGDIQKSKLEAMASGCNEGGTCSCECNSDMKNQIKSVEVSGNDGDVTISLTGENLEVAKIALAMQECDLEKHL